MSKLTRGAYRTFLDAAFGGTGTPKWWRLGKYTDDLSVNLNPDVSSNKNVWDESYVEDNGYEPSIESTTYYAQIYANGQPFGQCKSISKITTV